MFSLDAQIPFPESVGISNEKEKMDKSRPNSLGCRDDNLHSVIWPYIYVIIDRRSQVSKMEVDANRSQARALAPNGEIVAQSKSVTRLSERPFDEAGRVTGRPFA